MGRSPCCSKEGMNRGAWTAIEDKILTDYIKVHGEGKWRNIPKKAGLKRCGKSCRLRWMNYLRPDIKRGNISPDEEDLIVRLHKLLGNRWSLIAGRLPGRTDNEIKNYWNTHLSKKGRPPKSSNPSTSAAAEKQSTFSTSCVVRTKASRCNKEVFIVDRNIVNVGMDSNINIIIDAVNPAAGAESECSDAFSSENSNLDFMAAEAGENISLSLSEILTTSSASDFTKQLPQALCFSPAQEMEHDYWTTATHEHDHEHEHDYELDHLQPHLDSDFGSLVAFLESADDWLI